jgi:phage portal protein BeeE
MIPSSPIWTTTLPDYGYYDGDRFELLKLLAFYQKLPEVHGCIDLVAKGVSAAKPTLMQVVNKGAKNLTQRHLKRLSNTRRKHLSHTWDAPNLCRKSIDADEELVEVTEHPMLDTLHSTEQDQNFHALIRLTAINLCVYGITFWRKEYDSLGRLSSYQYLPSYNVGPLRDGTGRVVAWYYTSTFGDAFPDKVEVKKEDMVLCRWPSLSDPHAGGDSPLKSALTKIDISGKWSDHQNWILNNRARPDAVISVSEETSLEEAQRIEKRTNDKFRGPGNGRIAVVPGKFVPVSYPLTDLASLKFNEELKDALLFALGVPKSFITNDSNRATAAVSQDQLARYSLAPIVNLLEATLNSELKQFDGSENLLWVFENVVPVDKEQELAEETFELTKWTGALQFGAVTADEYREVVLGLDPLPEPLPEEEPETLDEAVEEEPEEEDDSEAEEESTDEPAGKTFNLLQLNNQVAKGKIDRATAINITAYSLSISQDIAKSLITKVKKENNGEDTPETSESDSVTSASEDIQSEVIGESDNEESDNEEHRNGEKVVEDKGEETNQA